MTLAKRECASVCCERSRVSVSEWSITKRQRTPVRASSHRRKTARASLGRRFHQRYLDVHLLLAAVERDGHAFARVAVVHHVREVLLVFDLLAIDRQDQIATQQYGDVPQVRVLASATQSGTLGG